ncbi:MAG: redoxin domain-containing protein [Phycisphaerae bacterium]|nr:redoxin domain-containing protein [Phycisphaerae bacterium]
MKLMTLILTIAISATLIIGCSKKEPAPEPASNDIDKTAAAEPMPVPAPTPTPAPKTATKKQLGQKAAALEGLTYVKGQPVTLTEGKVYVVEFWATWCPPCRVSIPHLTEIQKQFKDKGVTVIGISDENVNTVKPFVEKMGDKMDYIVAVDTKGTVSAGYMATYNRENTIPFACIVDAKGNVAWFGHPMDGMDEVLAQVVAGTYDAAAHAKAKAEAQAAERRLYELFHQYFAAVGSGAAIDQTRPIAEKFIDAGHPEALDAMAWQILMQADKANSDKPIALKAAEKANTLTSGENPMVLDTYALALFENARIAEAVAAQEKAVALTAGNKELQADLKTRLEKFKAALNTPETSQAGQ